jgi:HD-GYP domain-containing protein (c-di-GMP phosphodiesterase class II)
MKFDEEKFKEIAKSYFASARAGDWEHSLRVVKWVKELGYGRNDLDLLITAAYIHDIGWSGIAPKGKMDFEEMLKLEPSAAENSSRLISEVLKSSQFTDLEIQTVNRLVGATDKHNSEQEDEEIIVDADNLSKLCVEHLQEKYQPDSFLKLINRWDTELSKRIKTQKGKELFPKLLDELKQKILQ